MEDEYDIDMCFICGQRESYYGEKSEGTCKECYKSHCKKCKHMDEKGQGCMHPGCDFKEK